VGLLSAAAKTALQDGTAVVAFLLELEFTTGTERYWSGVFPLSYDSQTWQPTGGIGRIGEQESSEDFRANKFTVEVAGVPASEIKAGTLRAANYKGQNARFIWALVQGDSVLWSAPQYFKIDSLDYQLSGTEAGARITMEHETLYAARESVKIYSDAQQQADYPGDLAFEFLAYLSSGVEVRWGANGSTFKN
jgi:hypothetical protein